MSKNKIYNGYESIGKYIVEFQKLNLLIQISIQIILNKKGLSNEKENIFSRIILAERSIYDLLNIYKSLISEIYGDVSDDFKISKLITDFIKEEIEKHRNDIIHSFLFIDEQNIDNIIMTREKFSTKKGFSSLGNLNPNHLSLQIEFLENINRTLFYIKENLDKNFKVEGTFKNGVETIEISEITIKKLLNILKSKLNIQ